MTFGWVHNATPAVDAISQYPTILAVCIGLTAIMTTVIAMRAYVRAVMLKSVGPDDWTILSSAICSIIYNGLAIGQSRWGLGLPIALRPKVNTYNYKALNFTGRPFYMIGITGFKVALCLAYLRIVPPSKKIFKPIIWMVLVSCVLAHVAGTLVLIFQCSPIQKSLRPARPGHCLPDDKTFYALAAVTIFFDCVIFLLPIPLLVRVQISRRRKVGLIGVFVLGLFTTVCSILRMVQIKTIAKNGNSTMLVLWGTIEMNVGIILTCIPTLIPLFKFFRDQVTKMGDSGGVSRSGGKSGISSSSRTGTDRHRQSFFKNDYSEHSTSAIPFTNIVKEPDRKRKSTRHHNRGHHQNDIPETIMGDHGSSQESILRIGGINADEKDGGHGQAVITTSTSFSNGGGGKGIGVDTIERWNSTSTVQREQRRRSSSMERNKEISTTTGDSCSIMGGITRTTDVDVEISHVQHSDLFPFPRLPLPVATTTYDPGRTRHSPPPNHPGPDSSGPGQLHIPDESLSSSVAQVCPLRGRS